MLLLTLGYGPACTHLLRRDVTIETAMDAVVRAIQQRGYNAKENIATLRQLVAPDLPTTTPPFSPLHLPPVALLGRFTWHGFRNDLDPRGEVVTRTCFHEETGHPVARLVYARSEQIVFHPSIPSIHVTVPCPYHVILHLVQSALDRHAPMPESLNDAQRAACFAFRGSNPPLWYLSIAPDPTHVAIHACFAGSKCPVPIAVLRAVA